MTTTPTETKNQDIYQKLTSIGLLILGAVIIIIHILLYRYNTAFFGAFISLYFIVFTVLVIIYLYRIKQESRPSGFDFMTYASFFTIVVQFSLMSLSLIAFFKK